MASILETRQSDKKTIRGPRGARAREEFRFEQPVSLPFPLPLVKLGQFGGAVQTVWPLTEQRKQPFFTGKVNHADKCIDVYDPASVQCLYLMGFFGKGSRSRNQPIYKLRREHNYKLRPRPLRNQNDQGRSNKRETRNRREHDGEKHKLDKQWRSLRSFASLSRLNKRELVDDLYKSRGADAVDDDVEMLSNSQPEQHDADERGRRNRSPSFSGSDTTSSSSNVSPSASPSRTAFDNPSRGSEQEILKLGFEEAFFLSYALGLLIVVDADERKLTLQEQWLLYAKLHNENDPGKCYALNVHI